jgi:hypothetical protein
MAALIPFQGPSSGLLRWQFEALSVMEMPDPRETPQRAGC